MNSLLHCAEFWQADFIAEQHFAYLDSKADYLVLLYETYLGQIIGRQEETKLHMSWGFNGEELDISGRSYVSRKISGLKTI